MEDLPNFTAIDFETANPSPTSACSIALVRVENNQIVDSFTTLLKPSPFVFSHWNVEIHGIDETMCLDAPNFSDIWQQISPWIEDQVLVAHQITFDKNVLHNLLESFSLKTHIKDYLCSLELSKVGIPGLPNYKLPTVYHYLFNKNFVHHNALADAQACAEIVLRIVGDWAPPNFESMIPALYDAPPQRRTTRFGKVKLKSLFPEELFKANKVLVGSSFTFTEEIEGLSRIEAAQFVVNHGGTVHDSVTSTTTHLVVGGLEKYDFDFKPYTTKIKKAIELNEQGKKITILSGVSFLELMETIRKEDESNKLENKSEQ